MSEFESAWKTLSWAGDNVEKFKVISADLAAKAKAALIVDIEPETGNKIHKVVISETLPAEATRLVAETIVHCRHSLDQAVVAAWRANGLGDVPDRLYFPVANGVKDLEGRMKSFPLDRLVNIHDALRQIKPYPALQGSSDGNNTIIALSDAAQRKHTIVPKFQGMILHTNIAKSRFLKLVAPLKLPFVWNMDKGEIEIATTAPDGGIDVNMEITFNITVSGARKLDGVPILYSLLSIMGTCVDAVALIEEATLNS